MNYQESLQYIHGTLKFGIKAGLDNIKALLNLVGNPQDKLKFIHVAGTNGKGSTCSFINNILISAGFNTGLYTSPFIEVFNERIQINNKYIKDEEIAKLTAIIKEKIEQMLSMGLNHPTEFEIVTALGFMYFAQNACDIVVLEVGLGGRLDATNVIPPPIVSVITSISYDHTQYLGKKLSDIAFEKGGIIKSGSPTVLYPNSPQVNKILLDICIERDSKPYTINKKYITRLPTQDSELSFQKSEISTEGNLQKFNYKNFTNISIRLLGKHQILNAATALETINVLIENGYAIDLNHILSGFLNTTWPGRFEVVRTHPLFIIDGAHNVEGANVLFDTLSSKYSQLKKIFIIGLLNDKDITGILKKILDIGDHVITITPLSPRALGSSELAMKINKINPKIMVESFEKIELAVLRAIELANSESFGLSKSLICSFGSLYYIGEIKKVLNREDVV